MNSRHKRTLRDVFTVPVKGNIRWEDVESLLLALGCRREQGKGSRVRFIKDDLVATFHRPHPKPETDKGAVKAVRAFLEQLGVRP